MTLPLQVSLDDLGTPLCDVTFCVLDLETTGGAPAGNGITEIGAARYRYGQELAAFHTLVDPGGPIPTFVTMLTGITHTMVVGAPSIEVALPSFLEFMGDAVLVGHNLRYDLSFLRAATSQLGYRPIANRTLDTVALARRLVRSDVRNLKLATLAAHFRSPVAPIHRALDDARATAHVLWGLLERAGTIGVTGLEDLLTLPTARGAAHYDKIHLADSLPRSPGVYLFRDRHGEIIYVGKADNLRARVRSYFYGDERRSVGAILRELHSIDHVPAPSRVEAEVTELRLIHAHRPRHNRRSRPPRSACYVKLTPEAYPRLSLARVCREDEGAYLGPFRSRRAAELVMAAIFDATAVRRCGGRPGSRQAPCSPAQLGVAMCPCDGELTPADYAPVVDQIRRGMWAEPRLMLAPLAERMHKLAAEQRFEEAAAARDRHRALARAIERLRAWRAMQAAGIIEVEGVEGDRAVIDRGRLVVAWRPDEHPPLRPARAGDHTALPAPPTVAEAEEAHLVWRWLTAGRLIDAEAPLVMPREPVTLLG